MAVLDLFIYYTLQINYNVLYVMSVFLCCIPFITTVLLRYLSNSTMALEVSKISDLTRRVKFQKF